MDMSGMDMGGMDMSGMQMDGMSMAPGPAPMMAPSPGPSSMMNMGAMGMSGHDNMVMSMQMWFQASTNVTLWFREWSTDTKGKYAASVIGLMVLCLLQEALVWFRLYIARTAAGARRTHPVDLEAGASITHPDRSAFETFARFGNPIVLRLSLSFLYALNVFSSYFLMLAVMTFNVGYFIVIIVGLALGHMIFMRIEQPDVEERFEACCAAPCCADKPMSPKLSSAA